MGGSLNSSWSTNYKALARRTKFRECLTAEDPISHVVVDVRSRLFRYLRLHVPNRRFSEKVRCAFGLLTDRQKEEARVIDEAVSAMRKDVAILARNCTYVLCSQEACPFKARIKNAYEKAAVKTREDLDAAIESFKSDMFDLDRLTECHVAFESYLISNVEDICMALARNFDAPKGPLPLFVPPGKSRGTKGMTTAPDEDDFFESDRSCARIANGSQLASAVLSEDFDCVALFGAGMMIREVWPSVFTYTTLRDVMDAFCSTSRENLIHKCCILGTDYNHGIKGIGAVAIRKIDEDKARETFESCMTLQSTEKHDIMNFFLKP